MSLKPDHTTHGQIRRPSASPNVWTKDTKTKTAKCRVCEHKVDLSSWVCDCCGKRVCSECCKDDPSGVDYNKQCAKDLIEVGCWCSRFIDGYNGAMKRFKRGPPPKQEEQMAKDKEAKQKAMETSAKKKAAAVGGNPEEGSCRKRRKISEGSSELSELDDDDFLDPDASPTMLRPREERRTYQEPPSDEADNNGSDECQPDKPSFRKRRRTTVESDDEDSYVSPTTQPGKDKGKGKGKGKQAKASTTPSRSSNVTRPPLGRKPDGLVDPWTGKVHINGKRKSSAAENSSGETKATPSRRYKKVKKTSPLENGHTTIVGAGIVGLFTAYELASRCAADGISHRITVVEIRNVIAELASGMCAGFLTTRGIPAGTGWRQLASEAHRGWREIVRQAEHDAIRFVNDRTYFAQDMDDRDDDGDSMPDWFKPRAALHVGEDAEVMGRVNTRSMAAWLMQQCEGLDVQFRLGRTVETVQRYQDGKCQVTVGDPDHLGQNSSTIDCTNIVLSAGPFTTSIVQNVLNGGARTGLQNRCQKYLWADVPLSNDSAKVKLAITVATTDDWSVETLSMLVRPGSKSLEISAAEKVMMCMNIPSRDAVHVPAMCTTPLEDLAGREYLGVGTGQVLPVSARGGAMVSVASGRQPYVGVLQMRRDGARNAVEIPHIWLSYGFGRFGTTLAPGAARTLVGMMMAQP